MPERETPEERRVRIDRLIADAKVRREAGKAEARRVLAEVGMERREDEDVAAYVQRIRDDVSQGQTFEYSTELTRQGRIERTNELTRALGWDDLVEQP